MKKYSELSPSQKLSSWIVFFIVIGLIVAIPTILVLAPWQAKGSSLASSPDEIYEDMHIGMSLDDVYWAIDRDYANGACYLVNYESLSPYKPTNDDTDLFTWIFMPSSGRTPATLIWFYYDSSKDTSTVLDVSRMNYYEAQDLIVEYGFRTFW